MKLFPLNRIAATLIHKNDRTEKDGDEKVLAIDLDWEIREVIECPACKGRLHLSQAASNGHVHGRCETKGCVSWME